jgi:hypothetical protein
LLPTQTLRPRQHQTKVTLPGESVNGALQDAGAGGSIGP